jgi:phosphotriesterase-related protein
MAPIGAILLVAASAVGATAQESPDPEATAMPASADGPVFHTTAGPLTEDQVGDVLAHHHIFVELGAVPPTAYLEADPEVVNEVIGPWLQDAKALGIGTFIEFTPEGVGRRPDIVKYVADQAGLPTMLVTGIYREPFVPDWVPDATVEEIADWLRMDMDDVGGTGVPAGLIKLSQNDTGMTLTERRILEASCVVAKEYGAAIASHITSGPTALSVIDALEGFGCPLDEVRFVWVHSQLTAAAPGAGLQGGERIGADPGIDYLLAAAERGAYVSLDGIGSGLWGEALGGYDVNIGWIDQLVEAGYEDQIIIGADTGWFDPGHPAGFEIEEVDGVWRSVGDLAQDYRSVPEEFVPAMREAGYSEELIAKLMHGNPWAAFSR